MTKNIKNDAKKYKKIYQISLIDPYSMKHLHKILDLFWPILEIICKKVKIRVIGESLNPWID